MSDRPDRPTRPQRAEPREIQELRQLKSDQPELADAVDMQIDLVESQRRVQARIPLPWIQPDPAWLAKQIAAGLPAVRFGDIPLEWSDFRLSLRQTADVLYRHGALERDDHARLLTLARTGDALPPLVTAWYEATSNRRIAPDSAAADPSLNQVLALAIRPFLARSSESLMQRMDLSGWHFGHCPFCGWEPDFATITPAGDRRLICGRCCAQWTYGAYTCPFCSNDDRDRITSFATRDGRYRVYACDACHRYLKAYDARHASRPVLVGVDTIATLPLDAAAMQRGYTSE
ncbi:MAG: formate dehydrogenase accessory protein FdhE [Vicinamibacterales bacterium]